jgi:hypothetical protein
LDNPDSSEETKPGSVYGVKGQHASRFQHPRHLRYGAGKIMQMLEEIGSDHSIYTLCCDPQMIG